MYIHLRNICVYSTQKQEKTQAILFPIYSPKFKIFLYNKYQLKKETIK